MVHTDCFAYTCKNGVEGCMALNKLYCKKEECRFFKNDIDPRQIERSIRNYGK